MSEERDVGILPDEQEPDDLDDLAEEPDTGEEPDADTGGDPAEGDGGDDEPRSQPQAKAPGRRERQRAELRELRERSDRLERELQGVRQQQQPRVDNSAELARVAAYERDQLPLLPPDQISAYYHNKGLRTVSAALAEQEARITERLDQQAWQASCAANPRRARFAAQVEQTIAGMPAGPTRQREVVYKYLLGEEIDRQAARQSGGQRQAAQRRVRSQTTQPGGSRSDVVRERQPAASGQDYEGAMARMRGKALW